MSVNERPGLYQDFDNLHDIDMQQLGVQFLDDQNRWPSMLKIKAAITDALALETGQTVLDLGSGTGDDASGLASVVGPTGRVIGIDVSAAMVEIANQRTSDDCLSLEFHVGSGDSLDFPDNTFDRVRSERVFQWLTEPARVMSELVRVTKPGGRIVVCDEDYGTSLWGVMSARCNALMLDYICNSVDRSMPSPRGARDLPALFAAESMVALETSLHLMVQRIEDFSASQYEMLHRLVSTVLPKTEFFTDKDLSEILDGLERARLSASGERDPAVPFIMARTFFVVSGGKPHGG